MNQKQKDAQAKYRNKNRALLNQKAKDWRNNNPDKAKESAKKTRAKYAEKNSQRCKLWRENNTEKTKQYHIDYVEKNRDKLKKYTRIYYLSNKEYLDKKAREWKKSHPEYVRLSSHIRRDRKHKNGGRLSKGICEKLMTLQKGKCACCGESLKSGFHLDHIIPISLGGANTDDNVQLLKPSCNQKKNNKHPIDYMQSKGYLL